MTQKMGGGGDKLWVFFWGGDCTIMYNKILEDTQNGSGAELFLKNLEFVAQNRHYARQAGGRGGWRSTFSSSNYSVQTYFLKYESLCNLSLSNRILAASATSGCNFI